MMADTEQEQTESIVDGTEAVTPRQKAPRSDKQLAALTAAREKAMRIRQERADLSRKEREVARAQQEKEKTEMAARIQAEYEALSQPQPPKRRKPARRIIVHEASSATDEEDDTVDVILPPVKKPPTETELHYQRTLNKMFQYE
jgi:hypothetical protein